MDLVTLKETIGKSTQHRNLYHFTDTQNLESIRQNGLLSKNELIKRRLFKSVACGGNALSHELDRECGLYDYVSLCFTNSHPMVHTAQNEGRLASHRYLRISPDILELPNVQICMGVANSNGAQFLDVSAALPQIDFEVIYTRTDWADPNIQQRLQIAEKIEILVPNLVPKELILEI